MIMAIVVDDIWMVQMGVAVGGLALGLAKDPLAMSLSSELSNFPWFLIISVIGGPRIYQHL